MNTTMPWMLPDYVPNNTVVVPSQNQRDPLPRAYEEAVNVVVARVGQFRVMLPTGLYNVFDFPRVFHKEFGAARWEPWTKSGVAVKAVVGLAYAVRRNRELERRVDRVGVDGLQDALLKRDKQVKELEEKLAFVTGQRDGLRMRADAAEKRANDLQEKVNQFAVMADVFDEARFELKGAAKALKDAAIFA